MRTNRSVAGRVAAQMWKEEEHGSENVNRVRFAEAKATGVETLAVGCPFCLTMLSDASKADGGSIQVKDVAELVAEKLEKNSDREKILSIYFLFYFQDILI